MNFKYFIVLLLCYGLSTMSIAQCPTSNIDLISQADIDNFSINYPGCTMIPAGVNLRINDDVSGDITNLDGLSQLTYVGGDLIVLFNTALTSLDGLDQITSTGGDLVVFVNHALINLDGLSQITSVGERLLVSGNLALTNVNGLSQITSIGGDFEMINNLQLNQCCALCPLLTAHMADYTIIGGSVMIGYNNTGCYSPAEITACTPCTACVTDLTLTTTEMGSINYIAGNSIISTDTIADGENVEYDAGNTIRLESGFSTTTTSNFSAIIDGCQ